MGRPREHGPARRDSLLAAAARLLATAGPEALTVRAVAERAGTTTRAVYSLFGDKQGLLRALFRLAAQTMRSHHEAVPVHADPLEELVALAGAYRAAAREQPDLYEMYLGSTSQDLGLTDEDRALALASFERVQQAIGRCLASGVFPGRDVRELGLQLWATVHGLASLELRGYLGEPAAAGVLWDQAITATLAGYRGTPASVTRSP